VLTVTAEGGTPFYEYSVNGGAFLPGNVFNVPAGTHTVIVRDSEGCRTTCTITIAEPDELECLVDPTDVSDCDLSDGELSVRVRGGTAPYQYSLDGGFTLQTGDTFTGLPDGTYIVTVLDANGCETQCSATINIPEFPVCAIEDVTDALCNGIADGTITASGSDGSGTYEFSIDNGTTWQGSGTFTGLLAGPYTVLVRNAGSVTCVVACEANVGEPEELTCQVATTDETCALSDGSITAEGIEGTLPYEYSIDGSTFQTANVFTGLIPGFYTVTIRDANGCEVTCDAEILPDCFDLALTKKLSPTQSVPVTVGSSVTYDIEVCNQGTIDAYNIEVVDYILY